MPCRHQLLISVFSLAVVAVNSFDFCGVIYDSPSSHDDGKRPTIGTVPLTSVDVRAEIRGLTIGLVAELIYKNELRSSIEISFVFPLANSGAIYRLEAVIGDKKLVARVESREQAKKVFSQDAEMVAFENLQNFNDMVIQPLGNLSSQDIVVITIGYVQPMEQLNDGLLLFALPAVLNPRYIPKQILSDEEIMRKNFAMSDYVAVSNFLYKMSFSATVMLGNWKSGNRAIDSITATHPADRLFVSFSPGNLLANITMISKFNSDHDFRLVVSPSMTSQTSLLFTEPGLNPGRNRTNWLTTDVVGAWIMPKVDLLTEAIRPQDFEFWIVIDRSGSMETPKIADAVSAMIYLVKQLPKGCWFNMVTFGFAYEVLFPEGAVIFDKRNLDKSLDYLRRIDADMGGTELIDPLRYIYNQVRKTTLKRHILLVTDGSVINTNEVIDLTRQNAETTRVFAICIGEGASTSLVNGITQVSNGVAAFVRSDTDHLKTKVMDLLAVMKAPQLENANLTWTTTRGVLLGRVPNDFPKYFLGKPIFQSAVLQRVPRSLLNGEMMFSQIGIGLDFKGSFSIDPSSFSPPADTMPLHRLAARLAMDELVNVYYSKTDRSEDAKRRAIEMSKATGMLCEFTTSVTFDVESGHAVIYGKSPLLQDDYKGFGNLFTSSKSDIQNVVYYYEDYSATAEDHKGYGLAHLNMFHSAAVTRFVLINLITKSVLSFLFTSLHFNLFFNRL